jgi:hypothetical protein
MNKLLILISASIFFWSCTEDVSKDITTDLLQESDQFFQFSRALSETAYLVLKLSEVPVLELFS